MIVLRRGVLILLGFVGAAALLGFGVAGYVFLIQAGDRVDGESFLFWNMVVFVAYLCAYLIIILRARSLDRRLDRLIAQGVRRDIVPGRDFQNLGVIGDRLTTIFNQISRQNLMKTRKISAMHDLVEFLVRNSEKTILVCDVLGKIQYAGDNLDVVLNKERSELIGVSVQSLIPGIPFGELRAGLMQERQPRSSGGDFPDSVCYPIEDKSGELAYMLFLFNSRARFIPTRERSLQTDTAHKGIFASSLARIRKAVHW